MKFTKILEFSYSLPTLIFSVACYKDFNVENHLFMKIWNEWEIGRYFSHRVNYFMDVYSMLTIIYPIFRIVSEGSFHLVSAVQTAEETRRKNDSSYCAYNL